MSPISTCRGDWLLSFVYRTSSVQFRVAGLQPVLLQDRRMENVDLSSMVSAHLSFPGLCLCLCKEHQVTSAQQTPPCQSWRPVYTRDLPPVDSVPSPSPLSSNPHTAVRPELLPHFTDEETEDSGGREFLLPGHLGSWSTGPGTSSGLQTLAVLLLALWPLFSSLT